KAAEVFADYCKGDEKDVQARLRMGDAWAKAGKKDKAVAAYQWAAEGFAKDGFLPRAIAASKLILELDPTHTGVQKMLADLYARKSVGGRPAASSKSSVMVAPPKPGAKREIELSPDTPMEITSGSAADFEAPTAAPDFGKRAIDLDAPAAAKPVAKRATPAPPAQPSPTSRADAIDFEVGEASATSGVDLEVADATKGRVAPVPISPEAGIEIELTGGVSTTGEVEIPIEGVEEAAEDAPVLGDPLPSAPSFEVELASAPEPGPAVELSPPPEIEGVEIEPEPEPEVAPIQGVLAPPSAPVPAPPPPPASETALPPGLKPRRADAPSPSAPTAPHASTPSGRIWVPAAFSAPAPSTELEKSLEAAVQTSPSPPVPKPATAPSVASFTELELEGDSLLEAVEAAARVGQGQPAYASSPSVSISIEEAMEAVDEPKVDVGALPKIPLFSDLPPDAFIALFEQCPLRRVDNGQRIIEQGSHGESFFVICAGTAKVVKLVEGKEIELATLEEGTFFGEAALLSDAPRSASVDATADDTQLLEISAAVLRQLSIKHPTIATSLKKFCRQRLLSNLMASAPLFRPFTRSERRELVQKFRARDANRGELLIREGQQTDGLYVILTGEVGVTVSGHQVAELKQGEVFGEMSLLTRAPATATVTTAKKTSLLRLPREDFDKLIMSHPQILEMVAELSDARKKQNAELLKKTQSQMV
ncbi:MAG: cyclic nucleotide-binding domain-containing protein, partial [Archangium sp.]|nr:cyclic nucleotide-binding domain-containing protein [Archangium sp.]